MRADAEIETLVRAFEDCTLPRAGWTHREHLAVALWYRRHYPGMRRRIESGSASGVSTVTVVEDQHVVEDGHLLTSAGISAGIDLALRVVARYHGEAVARATARHMEYRYPDRNRRRVETTGRRNGRWWSRWLGIGKRGNPRR